MSTAAVEARAEQTPFRPEARRFTPRRAAAVLGAFWLLTAVYLVNPDQEAVVTRFGAVVEPRVLPGIHLSLPWPMDRVSKLKVRQLRRLVIGGDPADSVLGRSRPVQSQFLTGDQNIIHMRAVVQYSVGSPVDYLFRHVDVEKVIGAAVEAELARHTAHQSVDAVLTTGKVAIQNEVRAAAQKRLDEYRAGVLLSTVNLETVAPPSEAADAFRDVAGARADAARIVNQAEGYANDVIPKARGAARQLLESSEAYKQSKIDQAAGDAARFTQVAAEYSKAAQVTGARLYVETMEQILPKIRKLIVDRNGNLDLTIIRKSDAPAAPKK